MIKSREAIIPLAIAIGVGAGVGACGNTSRETGSAKTVHPTCSSGPSLDGLSAARIIGPNKEGTTNAVNGGECVGIYSPTTLKNIGSIAHNAAFDIVCIEPPKPAAFRVEVAGVTGDVNLADTGASEFNDAISAGVPNC